MKVDPDLAARLMKQEERYGGRDRSPLGVVLTRGDGVSVWDVQGNRYLDFCSGDGSVVQGHGHTRIAAAMVEQCLRLSLAPGTCHHDRLPPLLERLCTLTGFGAARLFGGAVEAALAARAAVRIWAGEARGWDPQAAEILVFDDPGPEGRHDPQVPFGDLAAVQAAVGPITCAILVEPFQGTGGVRPSPRGFLRGLRELCDARGLLLLVNEARSGLGRTGRLFGYEHEGIRPDGLILGRALSGGFQPVGAFLASREILDRVPESLDADPGGSPLACAVVSAALDVLAEERLVDRAAELGAYFLARLRAMESTRVREIRGQGLWAALDLRPGAGGSARGVCAALAGEGLLASADGQVLQLCPPLVISREQLDWALEKLERVLA